MSRNAGRAIAASCALGAIVGAGVLVYTMFVGDRAVAQAIPDVGQFRVGSELGEARAGFSGRAKVIVLTSAGEWASIAICLQSEEVVAEMDFFVGVLVDEVAEPEVEARLRESGTSVVIRGLQGQVLGMLPDGYACEDLVGLLRAVRASATTEPEPSPIYASLLERPQEAVDGLGEQAAHYVDLLEEFEGSEHPAVQAANARLGR